MLQETSSDGETNQEFYVLYAPNGDIAIKEVLIGKSMGVTTEKSGETLSILSNVENPPPEGMYAGTLEELLTYISTNPSSEESILRRFFGKIRRRLQNLFS